MCKKITARQYSKFHIINKMRTAQAGCSRCSRKSPGLQGNGLLSWRHGLVSLLESGFFLDSSSETFGLARLVPSLSPSFHSTSRYGSARSEDSGRLSILHLQFGTSANSLL